MRELPWITREAEAILEKYIDSFNGKCKILEFGSGGSTIWMARRTNDLISVEHDDSWHSQVKAKIAEDGTNHNVCLVLYPRPYDTICLGQDEESFDLVFVDGYPEGRIACAEASKRILKPGAMLLFDNAEQHDYPDELNRIFKGWKKIETIQTPDIPDPYDGPHTWEPNWTTSFYVKPARSS